MLRNGSSYFTAHHIPGVGTFQDGGLAFNNPASIAINEVATLFPTTPRPSIVLSLGTGSSESNSSTSPEDVSRLKQSFPARLFRAFWRTGDSNAAWNGLLHCREVQSWEQYYRLDLSFGDGQPALDDVDSMRRLAEMAREVACRSTEIEHLAKCIRAELFIFELDPARQPRLRNGVYHCFGFIRCRLGADTDEYREFMQQLTKRSASFRCEDQTLNCNFLAQSTNRLEFRYPITFLLPSRDTTCHIALQEGSSSICKISGSPFTIDWLIEQQQLANRFGREDHQ